MASKNEMVKELVDNLKSPESPEFLENYKYHSIFTISLKDARSKNPGEPYVDLFQCYSSEEFREAMMTQIQNNLKSESGGSGKVPSSLLSEVSAMKVTAVFKNSSPILCMHSQFKLSREDLDVHIKYGIGKEKIGEFINQSKLRC